jgi:hypothetical protein
MVDRIRIPIKEVVLLFRCLSTVQAVPYENRADGICIAATEILLLHSSCLGGKYIQT